MITNEDLNKLSAKIRNYGNGWITVDLYYDGKLIKKDMMGIGA